MKSEKKSRSTFSWLAYGGLSLSMLVIAAVSATLGQDQVPRGMGLDLKTASSFEMDVASAETELKKDRGEIDAYLQRRIIRTLHPERMSRRIMPAAKYQYAVKLHVEEDQQIDNLVRFEVSKTENSNSARSKSGRTPTRDTKNLEPVESTVVGVGILEVDSGNIFMETNKNDDLVTLERLGRDHFALMVSLKVEQPTEKLIVGSR